MFKYIVLANLGPFRTFSRAALDTPVHPCRRLYRKRERTFIKIAVVIIISEGTFLLGQLGKREKDGDALKVVQMKNGVETPVNYQGLSQVEKENALADILVKSAIEQVLEIHKQVKQNAILEAEASSRLRVKHEA